MASLRRRGPSMGDYKAFQVDSAGRVEAAYEFHAESDAAALAVSAAWAQGRPLELWNYSRLVFRSAECRFPKYMMR